jgi:K+-transporting ATPase ATPase A chain
MSSTLSFNTAVSFITGTNWQAYEGETQASYLAQMAGLVVAQFSAAAVGLSVALAVVRGIAGHARTVGNFWADLTRSLVRVFVPLSVLGAMVMVAQGAAQNFSGFRAAHTLAGGTQAIPGGPVASMEVIKLLGTNGGSFYGAGGAHPFENPTGFTNMFDLLLVIVLPFAIAFMFGRLIGRRRQGHALVAVMALLFLAHTVVSMQAEAHGNSLLPASVSQVAVADNPGGNMEGKEARFGADGSALMTVGTMGTTAGATDSALDSYTPVGGAGAFVGILLGEVSPGGDGGGLYSMLVFALLAVFVAGLMVGRTPEFLGKKIRGPQMMLVVTYVLIIPTVTLVFGALSLVVRSGTSAILNPGFHGLSEVTYAFASVANNNGSAFAGLAANTTWYNTLLALAMLVGRFVPIVLALAIAGSLAGARVHARTRATLNTTGPTFVVFLLGVIAIVGGLIYLPMLILGPIGERIVG